MNFRELIKELRLKREKGIVSVETDDIKVSEPVEKEKAPVVKTTRKRGKRK